MKLLSISEYQKLQSLLAILHRDGGQYQEIHTFAESIAYAEEQYYARLAEATRRSTLEELAVYDQELGI